jgi:hypothetical protein
MNKHVILNTLIHILILVLFLTFFINNKNDTNSVVFILAITVVFICYLLEFVRKPTTDELQMISNNNMNELRNNNMNELRNNNQELIEKFQSDLDMKIGPYDGIKLEDNNKSFELGEKYENRDCKWRKKPCDVPLLSNVGWVTPTGIEGKMDRLDQEDDKNQIVNYNYKLDLNLPKVSNDPKDPNAMFMFAFNQSHPDCCPSTFSTSTGCVCTTKQQREMINQRGSNRSKRDIYPAI